MHKVAWLNLGSNTLDQKQHLKRRKASLTQKRNKTNTRQQKAKVKTRSNQITWTRWRDQHYSTHALLKYHQSKKLAKKTRDRLWSMVAHQSSLMHPLSSKLRVQIKSTRKWKKCEKRKIYHKQIKRKGNESYKAKPNPDRGRKNQILRIIILVVL